MSGIIHQRKNMILLFFTFLFLISFLTPCYAENAAGTGQIKKIESSPGAVSDEKKASEQNDDKYSSKIPQPSRIWIVSTILILFISVGGGVAYLFVLQKRFLDACRQENQMGEFIKSAAGLPEGTIRAIIALIVIFVSLYLTVLLFFQVVGDDSKFPEVLSSLLGAVVGFYFGSKAGGKGEDEGAKAQVTELKTEKDKTQSDALLSKVKKAVDMCKVVVDVLPEEQKKKYGDIVDKLEKGYDTINTLTKGGGVKDAIEQGEELFELFKKENPVKDVFTQALGSFGTVLGGSVPALAIITTVVAVSVKLVGTAYEKWKKRVLNVPLVPAVMPLRVIDANTGFTLLLQTSIFRKVFGPELEGNDRPFMTKMADLLGQADTQSFYTSYKDRFDSPAQFEEGLQEFRRAALDSELETDIKDDVSLFGQAGGMKPFMNSLNQINKNSDAQSNLHQLVTIIEELQKNGEPVPTIFEKVQKEVGK